MRITRDIRCAARERSRGFTLIEVMVGTIVLIVAAGGFMASLVGGMQVREGNREAALAQLAARGAMERLQLTQFDEIFRSFNEASLDDPDGDGTAPGANFAVPGLAPQTNDVDGLVGRYEFPMPVMGPATELKENVNDPAFAMPRDLNGDGALDDIDHSGDYTLLPVRVVVAWRGTDGVERRIEFETFLTERPR